MDAIDRIKALLRDLMAENARLSQENKHVNVAFLGTRLSDSEQKQQSRLELFDGNHTRAQAKLIDGMKALEDRTKQAVASLHKRIKKLESQETLEKIVERIEKLETAVGAGHGNSVDKVIGSAVIVAGGERPSFEITDDLD